MISNYNSKNTAQRLTITKLFYTFLLNRLTYEEKKKREKDRMIFKMLKRKKIPIAFISTCKLEIT